MFNVHFFPLALILCGIFGVAINASGQAAVSPPLSPSPNPSLPGNLPPVAQTLVPEGAYAIQLLEALKLGFTQDDEQAETQLSKQGIEPKNGWISEYPVTPVVLGELDNAIALASEQGKITLNKNEALKQVSELKTKLGLNIGMDANVTPPAQNHTTAISTIYSYIDSNGSKHYTDDYSAIPPAYQSQAKIVSQSAAPQSNGGPPSPYGTTPAMPTVDPNALYSYYQNQGPPVLTYYAPPEAYYYLYSWVPYPFWWGGGYYPGFFMLNNFRQQVNFGSHPYFVSHHAGPARMFAGNPGATGGNWYAGNAQTGAKSIMSMQQNHLYNQPHTPYSANVNNGNYRNNGPGWGQNYSANNARQQQYVHPNLINQAPSFRPPAQVFVHPQFNQPQFNAPHAYGGGEFNNGFGGGGHMGGGFAGGGGHMGGGFEGGGGHMGGGHMGGGGRR
jgi:hypothetical protein